MTLVQEVALRFSVLRIWPIFGVLHDLQVFSNFVFGFRFSSTMTTVFRIVLSSVLYGFTGFAKAVTPRGLAKTGVIARDHLHSVLPFLTRGYAKSRNGFLLGLRYANVSLAHSGVESS